MPPLSACQQGSPLADPWNIRRALCSTGPLECSSGTSAHKGQPVREDPTTPPVAKKLKRFRCVSFSPDVKVRLVPNAKDFPKKIFKKLYASREDMNRMHQEAWGIVDLMNLGIEYEDHEVFSKRGLVDLMEDAVERRRLIKEEAYNLVFGIQAFYKGHEKKARETSSSFDYDTVLSQNYMKAAAQSKNDARLTGLRDAEAAGFAKTRSA